MTSFPAKTRPAEVLPGRVATGVKYTLEAKLQMPHVGSSAQEARNLAVAAPAVKESRS
jgi:hypothetical protein